MLSQKLFIANTIEQSKLDFDFFNF